MIHIDRYKHNNVFQKGFNDENALNHEGHFCFQTKMQSYYLLKMELIFIATTQHAT